MSTLWTASSSARNKSRSITGRTQEQVFTEHETVSFVEQTTVCDHLLFKFNQPESKRVRICARNQSALFDDKAFISHDAIGAQMPSCLVPESNGLKYCGSLC